MTDFILVWVPFWCWERALATRAKTRRGAIARKPPTKISPNRPIADALGSSRAKRAPTKIPIAIRFIRLVLFQV